ncbi:hypothetical protein FA95DRAFT_1611229 [Auriscalpium vulgare]|uniref:Uncharacterized protein n=1 Tax=Auriscalpium vulgare TaxID=40419 RepID=A0ACB8RC36_9AGAM|nr:hypothetical protein FA95DRAFT_1611229 [Auriscalpium vulgare]
MSFEQTSEPALLVLAIGVFGAHEAFDDVELLVLPGECSTECCFSRNYGFWDFSRDLFVNQVLRLSAHSKREAKLAVQVRALTPLLDSFGNAKTLMNPNASRHGRYFELHFNDRGPLSGAKVLTYGLDKSRLNRLTQEERTYHYVLSAARGCHSS